MIYAKIGRKLLCTKVSQKCCANVTIYFVDFSSWCNDECYRYAYVMKKASVFYIISILYYIRNKGSYDGIV